LSCIEESQGKQRIERVKKPESYRDVGQNDHFLKKCQLKMGYGRMKIKWDHGTNTWVGHRVWEYSTG
jgi:hypothetical protein